MDDPECKLSNIVLIISVWILIPIMYPYRVVGGFEA